MFYLMGFKWVKTAGIKLCLSLLKSVVEKNGPQPGQDANGLAEQLLFVKVSSK